MMMTTSIPFRNRKVMNCTTSLPSLPLLLLLASLSLSSAWAGAFNSGIISSPLTIHQPSRHSSLHVDGSAPRSHMMMKSSPTSNSSPSFLSLSTLLFLRGGQQQDEDTVTTSDETVSLDADGSMQQRYGSQDVEMTEGHVADAEIAAAADESSVTTTTKMSPLLSAMAPASSLLKTAAAFYTQQLTSRPIFTKALTAGIIFGLSDWCAQLVERRGENSSDDEAAAATTTHAPIVFSRILMTFLVGLLFFGPAANAWYGMIFKILPSTSLISTLQKAALGQIIFGPAFTCVFFGAGLIQRGSFTLGAWLEQIRTDLPAVWASGLGFWPLVDFISYKVVPVQWIPLFVNFCSFVWTIYLSLVANKGDNKVVEES